MGRAAWIVALTVAVVWFMATAVAGGEHHIRPARRVGLSLVIRDTQSRSGPNIADRTKRDITSDKPQITQLQVVSKISSRFAQTVIDSELRNTDTHSKQASFKVQIPMTAFISNFTMLIDDELYVAEVKSKEAVEEEYEEAVKQNKTAGKVSAETPESLDEPDRGMEWFLVAVNVKANSFVHFELTYLELLRRQLGYYVHTVSIRPGQVVQDLSVETYVYEPQGFSEFEVEEPITSTNSLEGNLIDTEITKSGDKVREVVYRPDVQRQKNMNPDEGISGDFVIRYDVNHGLDAGAVQFENNYFVHFFSPSGSELTPLAKNIIFVIDISGSMSGRKMEQTREAMATILDQLRQDDKFMLLIFDDAIETWPGSKEMVKASSSNIAQAKNYCEKKLEADGGTNIYDALIQAVTTLKSIGKVGANMVVFLTDGQPTVGKTNRSVIINDVASASNNEVSIFSLGFGFSLDYELLQSVSYRTGGFPRRIYEGMDAAVQLQNFFAEINSPLIYDISLKYQDNAVDTNSLTATRFSQYFSGSELVVAGRIQGDAPQEWTCVVIGTGETPINWTKPIDTGVIEVIPPEANKAYNYGFLEKLYVYLKIKDLLLEKYMFDDADRIRDIEKFALDLAVDYNLVTPLTSMLVVQGDQRQDERYRETAFGRSPGMAFDMNSKVYAANSNAEKHQVLVPVILIAIISALKILYS